MRARMQGLATEGDADVLEEYVEEPEGAQRKRREPTSAAGVDSL